MIDCCDLVILATPPGFRPQHIEAAVKAGKNLFTEKPVAVDGTGIRKVLAAAEEAKQEEPRRSSPAPSAGIRPATSRAMKRIHDGAIGELVAAPRLLEPGDIWAHARQAELDRHGVPAPQLVPLHLALRRPHRRAARPQPRRGQLGARPTRSAASAWAAGRSTPSPSYGQSFDHFAVDYEYPNGVHVMSMCPADRRLREQRLRDHRRHQGPVALATDYRFDRARPRPRPGPERANPYVQEHIDLLESITTGKPINELKQVAESTLTAIMGRMSAYTGKAVTWEQALNSKLDTFPKTRSNGPPSPARLARPGQTELI